METSVAVDTGVALFAELEEMAQDCVDTAKGFDAVFNTLHANGVISAFEAKALRLEARKIALDNLAAWHIFHAKTTQRAQLKGVDVPQAEGGGDR